MFLILTIEPCKDYNLNIKYRGRIKKGRQKKGGRRQRREKKKGRNDESKGEGWLEKWEER